MNIAAHRMTHAVYLMPRVWKSPLNVAEIVKMFYSNQCPTFNTIMLCSKVLVGSGTPQGIVLQNSFFKNGAIFKLFIHCVCLIQSDYSACMTWFYLHGSLIHLVSSLIKMCKCHVCFV